MSNRLNIYGDQKVLLANGHGVDIATQRADDLDILAIDHLKTLTSPIAVDVACGGGGQSIRMAVAGANTFAVDVLDFSANVNELAKGHGVAEKIHFLQMDMRNIGDITHFIAPNRIDVIICQRAMHYLRVRDALDMLREMNKLLSHGGALFISASGIESELGCGYAGDSVPLSDRYAPLSAALSEKHGIHGDVCLYSPDDMRFVLETAGFSVKQLFSSPFGNVKAVAYV